MPVSPSARFQVLSAPALPPGRCLICRSAANGPFIDTGISHDFYGEAPNPEQDGRVYICTACIKDMANTLELADPEFDRQLVDERRAGVLEGIMLGKRHLDEFANSFIGLISAVPGIADLNPVVSDEDPASDEPAESEDAKGPDSPPVEDEQSDSSEGPDDVPSNRSDDVFAL